MHRHITKTKMIFKKLEKDFGWGFEKMRDKFENFKKIQIENISNF